MNLTTPIHIPEIECKFTHENPFMLIGSCFTENIGNKLIYHGFRANINPFGILYNPVSIAHCITSIIENRKIKENDIFFYNELWHSYYHHGIFSRREREACISQCNQRIEEAHLFLKKSNILILTFGSAWIYTLKDTGIVVGNCHKLPGNQFEKRLLVVDEIVQLYTSCFQEIKKLNPSVKIILTISPVRHWKDGFRQNQISKSVLHLSVHQMQQIFEDLLYFPSYEIMMDELRDYRFYDSDFLHPNELSIKYIWNAFSELLFSKETLTATKQVEKLRKMIEHKPFQPEAKAWEQHILKAKQFLMDMEATYPYVNFGQMNLELDNLSFQK